MIIVDTREKEPFLTLLRGMTMYEQEKLDWGDVEIRINKNPKVTFERKTINDFYASLRDGRYDEQIPAFIKYNIKRPVLVIIGRIFELKQVMPLLNDMIIFGAVGSLFTKYGMEVMFFETDEQFIKFLINVNTRFEKGEEWSSRNKIDIHNPIISKIQFLTNIPNITADIACALLVQFGSIKRIAEASEKELMEVPTIGEKRAKYIYNLFNQSVDDFLIKEEKEEEKK